ADIVHHADNQIASPGASVKGEREVLNMAIKLAAYLGQGAIADLGEADGLPIRSQGAQAGDGYDCNRRKSQQGKRFELLQPGQKSRPAPGTGANDVVENKFQGPGFEQPQPDLRKQGQQRTGDQ